MLKSINFFKITIIFFFCLLFSNNVFSYQIFQTALTSIPPNLDPADSVDTSSGLVNLQMYEALFTRDQKGIIEAGLIKTYKISPERDQYTFTLKDDLKFHDNSDITSEDVIYSISRRINQYVGSLEIIKGAEDYYLKKSKNIEGLRIVDKKNFKIYLNNSFSNLPEILSDLTLSVVPRNFEKYVSNSKYVGSGPYRLVNKSNEQIELEVFDKYYGKTPDINKIVFRIIKSEDEASKLLESDKLDHTHPFDIDLSSKKEWQGYSFLNASVQFISLNPKYKQLKNIETRKILLSLIPFEQIQKELDPKSKYLISHFIPLGLPGYIPEKWVPPYSEEYAKKKIKEMKWTTPLIITNYLPDIKYKKVVERICSVWKENNVPCTVNNINLDEAIALIKKNSHQVLVGKFIPDIPDTSQVLSFFKTDNYIPVFNLQDKKIDEMLNRALKNPSGHMRTDYYRVINRLIFEHNAVVPLQYGGTKTYYTKKIFKIPDLDITGPFFLRVKNIQLVQ